MYEDRMDTGIVDDGGEYEACFDVLQKSIRLSRVRNHIEY